MKTGNVKKELETQTQQLLELQQKLSMVKAPKMPLIYRGPKKRKEAWLYKSRNKIPQRTLSNRSYAKILPIMQKIKDKTRSRLEHELFRKMTYFTKTNDYFFYTAQNKKIIINDLWRRYCNATEYQNREFVYDWAVKMRDVMVFDLYLKGTVHKITAREFGISEMTVKNIVRRYKKVFGTREKRKVLTDWEKENGQYYPELKLMQYLEENK